MTTILFPCNPLNKREVDPAFLDEYSVAKNLGKNLGLIDYDEIISDNPLRSNSLNKNDFTEIAIYRGWMLNKKEYKKLYHYLLKELNYKLINNVSEYIKCHHFPEFEECIEKYTPKSWSIRIENFGLDICSSVTRKFQPPYLIKDFVKSEKGIPELFYIEACNYKELYDTLLKFKLQRGKRFEGGFVIKQFVKLKKYEDKTNEYRVFILNEKLYTIGQNSNLKNGTPLDLNFVNKVLNNIHLKDPEEWDITSNFYTLDFAELEDGSWTVLECGDAQVSGLSSSKEELIKFYGNL